MKNKWIAICLFISAILISGCAENDSAAELNDALNSAEVIEKIEELPLDATNDSMENSVIDSEILGRIAYAGENYTWEEVQIIIPQAWLGKYVVKENENGIAFYQKASNEKEDILGFLCGIYRSDEYINSGTGETLVAYTEEGMLYYVTQPTDVACYLEDEEITAEYMQMMECVSWISGSLKVTGENVHYDANQYEIPVSRIILLEEYHLANLTNNELWIARNEIYARHGRIFQNEYLASYFDSCSWYEMKEGKNEVGERELNEVEIANLKLIIAAEEKYAKEHPYPKQYEVGEKVKETLYQKDGEKNICYEVLEDADLGYRCVLTINRTAYDLSDYVTMVAPVEDVYYITDIAYYDEMLEIAIMDDGPSDDAVTHFFQFDGELHYVGEVHGFPFKDYGNSFFDGFSSQNSVVTTSQLDLVKSSYVQAYYWYNSEKRTLEHVERSSTNYIWFDAHELYVDLPLYYTPNEDAPMITLKAQKKVYFVATDGKEWILVRGSDGVEGYIRVNEDEILNIGLSSKEVFSELYFFG